jgi:hypothetical protein
MFATTVRVEMNATLHVCESGLQDIRIFLGLVPKESPCISHQAPNYKVLVSDHNKIRKVPLQQFSLWCVRTDRPAQGTRLVTM